MEKTTKRESESASAVGVKSEHMGHMGLEYMGQDIYLTPLFKLKAEMEDLKR